MSKSNSGIYVPIKESSKAQDPTQSLRDCVPVSFDGGLKRFIEKSLNDWTSMCLNLEKDMFLNIL